MDAAGVLAAAADSAVVIETASPAEGMLHFLPATIEASFTDVPRVDGTTGQLTLVLHPESIPAPAEAPAPLVPDAPRE